MKDSELKSLEQRLMEYNRNRLFVSNAGAEVQEYCLLDIKPGQSIEQCRLGTGTFAAVYRIWRYEIQKDGRIEKYPAALKAVPLATGVADKLEKKIAAEADIQRLLSRLGNVVCYEDRKTMTYAENGRDILIRMELLEQLDAIVKPMPDSTSRRDAQESLVEILHMWRDIATALFNCECVHVVHKDVKPDNIYYAETNRTYKLGDFGESEICNASKQPGKTMKPGGTMAYIAPEVYAHYPRARKWAQEQGDAWMLRQSDCPFDIRADMYSLAMLVYEKLNGARPFEMDSANLRLTSLPEDSYFRSTTGRTIQTGQAAVAARILERKPIPPIRNVPKDVNEVLLKCLNPDPEQRYASCQELRYVVEGLYRKYYDELIGGENKKIPPVIKIVAGTLVVLCGTVALYLVLDNSESNSVNPTPTPLNEAADTPTPTPTTTPTLTDEPTSAPVTEPTDTPEPTQTPTPEPTQETTPTPVPVLDSIAVDSSIGEYIYIGADSAQLATLEGTAQEGQELIIYLGTGQGDAFEALKKFNVLTGGGKFTSDVDLSGLEDGEYTLRVAYADAEETYAEILVCVDTVAPVIQDVSPEQLNQNDESISVLVSDADEACTVELRIDGELAAEGVADAQEAGRFTVSLGGLALSDDSELCVVAIDQAGNESEPFSLTYAYDAQAMSVTANLNQSVYSAESISELRISLAGDENLRINLSIIDEDGNETVVASEENLSYYASVSLKGCLTQGKNTLVFRYADDSIDEALREARFELYYDAEEPQIQTVDNVYPETEAITVEVENEPYGWTAELNLGGTIVASAQAAGDEDTVSLSLDGCTDELLASADYQIELCVTDEAGNSSSAVISYVRDVTGIVVANADEVKNAVFGPQSDALTFVLEGESDALISVYRLEDGAETLLVEGLSYSEVAETDFRDCLQAGENTIVFRYASVDSSTPVDDTHTGRAEITVIYDDEAPAFELIDSVISEGTEGISISVSDETGGWTAILLLGDEIFTQQEGNGAETLSLTLPEGWYESVQSAGKELSVCVQDEAGNLSQAQSVTVLRTPDALSVELSGDQEAFAAGDTLTLNIDGDEEGEISIWINDESQPLTAFQLSEGDQFAISAADEVFVQGENVIQVAYTAVDGLEPADDMHVSVSFWYDSVSPVIAENTETITLQSGVNLTVENEQGAWTAYLYQDGECLCQAEGYGSASIALDIPETAHAGEMTLQVIDAVGNASEEVELTLHTYVTGLAILNKDELESIVYGPNLLSELNLNVEYTDDIEVILSNSEGENVFVGNDTTLSVDIFADGENIITVRYADTALEIEGEGSTEDSVTIRWDGTAPVIAAPDSVYAGTQTIVIDIEEENAWTICIDDAIAANGEGSAEVEVEIPQTSFALKVSDVAGNESVCEVTVTEISEIEIVNTQDWPETIGTDQAVVLSVTCERGAVLSVENTLTQQSASVTADDDGTAEIDISELLSDGENEIVIRYDAGNSYPDTADEIFATILIVLDACAPDIELTTGKIVTLDTSEIRAAIQDSSDWTAELYCNGELVADAQMTVEDGELIISDVGQLGLKDGDQLELRVTDAVGNVASADLTYEKTSEYAYFSLCGTLGTVELEAGESIEPENLYIKCSSEDTQYLTLWLVSESDGETYRCSPYQTELFDEADLPEDYAFEEVRASSDCVYRFTSLTIPSNVPAGEYVLTVEILDEDNNTITLSAEGNVTVKESDAIEIDSEPWVSSELECAIGFDALLQDSFREDNVLLTGWVCSTGEQVFFNSFELLNSSGDVIYSAKYFGDEYDEFTQVSRQNTDESAREAGIEADWLEDAEAESIKAGFLHVLDLSSLGLENEAVYYLRYIIEDSNGDTHELISPAFTIDSNAALVTDEDLESIQSDWDPSEEP